MEKKQEILIPPNQKIKDVDFRLCPAIRVQIEGDTSLLNDVIKQIRYTVAGLTNGYYNPTEEGIVFIPNVKIATSNQKLIDLDVLKIEFVEGIQKSQEGIINAINYNNIPICRVFLLNSIERKKDDLKDVKNFITSNYDRKMLSQLKKGKTEIIESQKALVTHYSVFCIGKVTKAMQKKFDFVFSHKRNIFSRNYSRMHMQKIQRTSLNFQNVTTNGCYKCL